MQNTYKVGDRFHDTSQRERKIKEFEITKIDGHSFIAIDLNEPDNNKWAGRTKYCYTWTAVESMESGGVFKWH